MKLRTAIVPLLLGAALLALGWWATRPPSFDPMPVEFPAYELEEFNVTARWQVEQASASELTEVELRLLGAWRDANVARALLAVDLFEGDASIAFAREGVLRGDVLLESGTDRLRVVGWAAYAEFREGLAAALAAIGQRQTTVAEFMRDVTDDEVQAALPSVGDFLVWSVDQGIVTSNGELTVPETTLALLFFYKWLVESAPQVALEQTLQTAERTAFERWKIEDSGASLDSKLRSLAQLDPANQLRGMPRDFYEGVLRWKAGEHEGGLALLLTAAQAAPHDNWVVTVARSAELEASE